MGGLGRDENKSRKLIQINTVSNGSTGRIMHDIQRRAESEGFETISFVGRRIPYSDVRCERFGTFTSFWTHVILTTIFDRQGFGSYFATERLVRRLREENPDIIHLHNLHGYYLHLPTLMTYLTDEFAGKVVWTFHDCWPITGHCAYFTSANCRRWTEHCYDCPKKREYPISLLFDNSRRNYSSKRSLFSRIKNLTITVPSAWMAKWVSASFLADKETLIVPNGIDVEIFDYHNAIELSYEKYGIPYGKRILLGVAGIWEKRKGLSDLIDLADVLPPMYQIVLVGLNRNQSRHLSSNITAIPFTDNINELVSLYSHATVFLNPSTEESFSLVTVEALACGTPVIALDTSAVRELVIDESNGIILNQHAPCDYLSALQRLEELQLGREIVRESGLKFSNNAMLDKMMEIYDV